MKKNSKNILKSVIATSIATAGFVSYKVIKKKYPDKVDNINKNIKNAISKVKNNHKKIEDIPIDKLSTNNVASIDNIKNKLENTPVEDVNINTENNEIVKDLDKEDVLDNNYIKTLEDIEKAKEDIQKHINDVIKENEENILMPDNYIEDEIRYQLCLSNKEPITKNVLQKLERIDFFEIDDNDIAIYCDFLKEYTNIKSIVIDALNPLKHENVENTNKDKHCLRNISPLNNLTSLEELSFNWGIENIDFSSLTNLNNLKKLEIKFGMLENIDFLKNLENLEHIEIMLSNNIKDLSILTNLKKLKRVYIYTNIDLDINILKNMPNLKYLYINGESISL